MRISTISSSMYRNNAVQERKVASVKVNSNSQKNGNQESVSFKGAKGFLIGGLAAFTALLTAGIAAPLVVLGTTGFAGSIGSLIEDKNNPPGGGGASGSSGCEIEI